MPLVIGFVALLGAALLLTSAVADASFADVITGKAGQTYRAHEASSIATPSSSSSPSSSGPVSAAGVGSSAGSIVDYLVSRGLTPVAAAGVVGNLQQESSLNPKEAGGGLAQWIGSRWTALVSFAGGLGVSPDSADAQLQFLMHELASSYPGTLAAINQASTPEQAATIFSEQYERPGTPMLANRQSYAQAAYKAAGY